MLLERNYFLVAGTGGDQVVDIDADDQCWSAHAPLVHRMLKRTALGAERRVKLGLPCPGHTFESLQCLSDAQHLSFVVGYDEAHRLMHEDFFTKVTFRNIDFTSM